MLPRRVLSDYNAQKHSILGISPLERYALDRNRIRYLPPNETNDELFFAEEERHVRADNTFFFRAARYEAPRHLPERKIQIRHRRSDKSAHAPLIVYYKNERLGRARLVNLAANDRKPPRAQPPPDAPGAPGAAAAPRAQAQTQAQTQTPEVSS